jgi:predicted TIM-barrel fold metal-dependent hydrolase
VQPGFGGREDKTAKALSSGRTENIQRKYFEFTGKSEHQMRNERNGKDENLGVTAILDAHVYIGKSINGYSLASEQLFDSMDELGIEQAVVCPVQPDSYRLEPENDRIADTVAKHSDRLIGFCRVDPRQGKSALKELERSCGLGLRGLLLHPWEEGYPVNSKDCVKLVASAAEIGVPTLVEAGYPWVSHASQSADLCFHVPNATVMLSHGGQLNISGMARADTLAAMASHSNLYIQTSGVYRQDFLEEVIERFGIHRVIFGSTFPVMDQRFELQRIKQLALDSEDKADILGRNILRLIQ